MASAFQHYLRTGRSVAPAIETKFNPWHDPEDGRFTFAGQGRYFSGLATRQQNSPSRGFRGGGGSFGGGGAGGSWAIKKPIARDRGGSDNGGGAAGNWSNAPLSNAPSSSARPTSEGPSRSQGQMPVRRPAEPRLSVRRNGYEFSIDAHARTRQVTGEIRLQSQPRSRSAQANAGKPDRRGTDDGGHYIAARFNGPRDWFNHFAQRRKLQPRCLSSDGSGLGKGGRIRQARVRRYRSVLPGHLNATVQAEGNLNCGRQARDPELPERKSGTVDVE